MKKLITAFITLAIAPSAWAVQFESFQDYAKIRNELNQKSNTEIISFYHRELNPSDFAIVDKKTKTLKVYDRTGKILKQEKVTTYPGDEKDEGGAGIYYFAGTKSSYTYGRTQSDEEIRGLFFGEVQLAAGTPIYLLPESADHKFRLRNEELIFNAAKVLRHRPDFNYSPSNLKVRQSQFEVAVTDSFSKRYVRTLQNEKATLMQLLKIDNDEYNMLAEFAFGVLSPETDFGSNWKYQLKQTAPVVVSILKGNGLDTSHNSRGPTQIKQIPPVISEHYKIEKSDLKVPENAAVTTLAFVAVQIKELRNMAHQHPDISEETLQDYMYYLYQGRRYEVREGTATPERNLSIQKIKAAIEFLSIRDL